MVNRDTMIRIIESAKGEGRKQGAINSMKDELDFLNVLRISLGLGKKGFPNALTDRIFEIEKRLKELE